MWAEEKEDARKSGRILVGENDRCLILYSMVSIGNG